MAKSGSGCKHTDTDSAEYTSATTDSDSDSIFEDFLNFIQVVMPFLDSDSDSDSDSISDLMDERFTKQENADAVPLGVEDPNNKIVISDSKPIPNDFSVEQRRRKRPSMVPKQEKRRKMPPTAAQKRVKGRARDVRRPRAAPSASTSETSTARSRPRTRPSP